MIVEPFLIGRSKWWPSCCCISVAAFLQLHICSGIQVPKRHTYFFLVCACWCATQASTCRCDVVESNQKRHRSQIMSRLLQTSSGRAVSALGHRKLQFPHYIIYSFEANAYALHPVISFASARWLPNGLVDGINNLLFPNSPSSCFLVFSSR